MKVFASTRRKAITCAGTASPSDDLIPTYLVRLDRKCDSSMKMIAEYLENALKFERMAAEEKNLELKTALEKQAISYRKLAANRASWACHRRRKPLH
jgi:hypothetical protein